MLTSCKTVLEKQPGIHPPFDPVVVAQGVCRERAQGGGQECQQRQEKWVGVFSV